MPFASGLLQLDPFGDVELDSAAECLIAQMRIRDPRVGIVRDGHEPNEAEEQRPCRVPIEPVHVVSPRKDRREQEGYQHSAKASRGFVAFALRYCDAQRRQPVQPDRPAEGLTASVIRSPGVVDAFSQFRQRF
jgi:hypothetical protein